MQQGIPFLPASIFKQNMLGPMHLFPSVQIKQKTICQKHYSIAQSSIKKLAPWRVSNPDLLFFWRMR
jgi:hypothetical protein